MNAASEKDQAVYRSIADNYNKDNMSVEALKANLHYYERLKMKAFEAHKKAIIDAHEAMTALNNALLRECGRG